jgi:tellurite methyltransferase
VSLQDQFGQIDIYVFDQILRGNLTPGMCIVDAGCGYGRNLVYLLRQGAQIFAVDQNAEGIDHVRRLSASLNTGLPPENFQVAPVERMPFPSAIADAVLCSAVLHFASDEDHFRAMLSELWRVLKPGGLLFVRLGSRIGMDFPRLQGNLFQMPDGSKWFLVDEEMLLDLTDELNAVLVDPLKTTIVQDLRSMTTWVLRKRLT